MPESSFSASESFFIQALVSANRLEKSLGAGRLLFFPGMLFGSMEKWWGRGGTRAQSHEGLDICFFADGGGINFRLDETVRIPAASGGRVAGIIPDFLGSTVIAQHDNLPGQAPCYILYAHVLPDEQLKIGQPLSAGETFAAIAPPIGNRLLPPHLHLSMMDTGSISSPDSLDWPLLNRMDRRLFLDPLELIDGAWQVMDFTPGIDLYEMFGSYYSGS